MCFTVPWIEHFLIQIIAFVAVIAILQLLLPWLFAQLRVAAGPLPQIVRIVVWAMTAIFVIVVVFDLLSCLMSPAYKPLSG